VVGGPHDSAAKAAILGYTKAAARELGPDNISVNAICPGFIDTDITAGMMTPERLAAIVASVPMGRPGHAHELAHARCSSRASSRVASPAARSHQRRLARPLRCMGEELSGSSQPCAA
jgi:NAD(P)-dependent dehydrogenase (short-subunit alcohol dehydrogenase family)